VGEWGKICGVDQRFYKSAPKKKKKTWCIQGRKGGGDPWGEVGGGRSMKQRHPGQQWGGRAKKRRATVKPGRGTATFSDPIGGVRLLILFWGQVVLWEKNFFSLQKGGKPKKMIAFWGGGRKKTSEMEQEHRPTKKRCFKKTP